MEELEKVREHLERSLAAELEEIELSPQEELEMEIRVEEASREG